MPTRANPNSLTVDQLTRELKSRNVVLPKSSIRKEVLVDLYKKHVLSESNTNSMDVYSSDDDEVQIIKADENNPSTSLNEADILNLSDSELRTRLKSFDENVGPITNTTRSVYRKKLTKFIRGELVPQNTSGTVPPIMSAYSDDDDDDDDDGGAVEEGESVETHDVSVQNDFDSQNGDPDEGVDDNDLRTTRRVEVVETRYTKTAQNSQPISSLWTSRYERDNISNIGNSSRIKNSEPSEVSAAEKYRPIRTGGIYKDMYTFDDTGLAPKRDFHRRSLAAYGLTSRPPLSTYSSSRVTPTRNDSNYMQDGELNIRHHINPRTCSPHLSGWQKKIRSRESSCVRKLLIAVFVLILLSMFGYLVYLNVEPEYLPKLDQIENWMEFFN